MLVLAVLGLLLLPAAALARHGLVPRFSPPQRNAFVFGNKLALAYRKLKQMAGVVALYNAFEL